MVSLLCKKNVMSKIEKETMIAFPMRLVGLQKSKKI